MIIAEIVGNADEVLAHKFDSYCESFNVVLKGEIDLSRTQSSTLALHPAFQRRIAVELKWK